MSAEFIWTLSLTAVAVIVWGVRLEGKANATDHRVDDLRDDVHYIRDRIDEALDK